MTNPKNTGITPDGYPELLADLAVSVSDHLVKHQIASSMAAKIGFSAAEFMRAEWGGQQLYIYHNPSRASSETSSRMLSDLAGHVSAALVEHQTEPARAAELGLAVSESIRGAWGGESLYIPSGAPSAKNARYIEIYNKCNGINHRQLAREYGISIVRVYQIIKLVAQQKRAGQKI